MDLATMALLPATCATMAFLGATSFSPLYVYSMVSAAAWFYRVRDKTMHPEFDEAGIKDLLYANETVKKYFHDQTSYVIDQYQEYDKFNLEAHAAYGKSPLARFFNVDCNTTTGYLKMCDVESDARMTINFKTMPWSDEKFKCSYPFLFTELTVEINCKGVV
jgi:hypothetical protein